MLRTYVGSLTRSTDYRSSAMKDAMTSPMDSPAAVIACGIKEVSVIPGATLTSRNHTIPSSSTITSVRERSLSPRAT